MIDDPRFKIRVTSKSSVCICKDPPPPQVGSCLPILASLHSHTHGLPLSRAHLHQIDAPSPEVTYWSTLLGQWRSRLTGQQQARLSPATMSAEYTVDTNLYGPIPRRMLFFSTPLEHSQHWVTIKISTSERVGNEMQPRERVLAFSVKPLYMWSTIYFVVH